MLTSGPQKKHTLLAVEFLIKKVRRQISIAFVAGAATGPLMAALRSRSPAVQPGPGMPGQGGRLGCG